MSTAMLDDDNAMNRWNPLVQENTLSGSVSRAGNPASYTAGTEDVGWLVPDKEQSIACSLTRTMGDKTIDFCSSRPMCDPKRRLEPHRNIDHGFEDALAREKIRGPQYVGSGSTRRIAGRVARHGWERYKEEILMLIIVIVLLRYISTR